MLVGRLHDALADAVRGPALRLRDTPVAEAPPDCETPQQRIVQVRADAEPQTTRARTAISPVSTLTGTSEAGGETAGRRQPAGNEAGA